MNLVSSCISLLLAVDEGCRGSVRLYLRRNTKTYHVEYSIDKLPVPRYVPTVQKFLRTVSNHSRNCVRSISQLQVHVSSIPDRRFIGLLLVLLHPHYFLHVLSTSNLSWTRFRVTVLIMSRSSMNPRFGENPPVALVGPDPPFPPILALAFTARYASAEAAAR